MPDAIPSAVSSLVVEHIRSIAQLELLLLLHGRPERACSAEDAAKELYTSPEMSESLLETLRKSGLVKYSTASHSHYQYAPTSPVDAASVAELARLYRQRPVTIINLIYAAPDNNLQNFADAFRIRKKEES